MADNIDKPWAVHRLATSGAALAEIAAPLVEAETDATAGTSPTEPAPLSPINKMTWAQVGWVTEPGRYIFKFGWFTYPGGFSRVGAISERGVHLLQKGEGDRRSRRRLSSRHIRTAKNISER
jgi:hypothetical protein